MYKKLIILSVLLTCAVFSLAALDFGLGADFHLQSRTIAFDDLKATETTMILSPFAILKLSETLELAPFVTVKYTVENDPDGITGQISDEESQLSIGLGSSILFHILKVKKLDVSVGGKLSLLFGFQPQGASAPAYNEYSQIDIDILAPIVVDFNFYKNFYLRLKYEIPVFGLGYLKTGTGAGTASTTTLNYLDIANDFNTFRVYIGAFYLFSATAKEKKK